MRPSQALRPAAPRGSSLVRSRWRWRGRGEGRGGGQLARVVGGGRALPLLRARGGGESHSCLSCLPFGAVTVSLSQLASAEEARLAHGRCGRPSRVRRRRGLDCAPLLLLRREDESEAESSRVSCTRAAADATGQVRLGRRGARGVERGPRGQRPAAAAAAEGRRAAQQHLWGLRFAPPGAAPSQGQRRNPLSRARTDPAEGRASLRRLWRRKEGKDDGGGREGGKEGRREGKKRRGCGPRSLARPASQLS